MKRNESNIITRIPGCKPGRLVRHLTDTQQIDLCPNCMCATKVLMDDDDTGWEETTKAINK